jgi:transcriptional regulator with XRE-family HTH domain
MTFPINLEALRTTLRESELTMLQLAELTGLSRRTLERWRRGTITRARISSLEAVASALGVTVGDLVMG